jgi:hypothetical protein
MSDALSFAEFDGQRVELPPARIRLSLISAAGGGRGGNGGLVASAGRPRCQPHQH